MKGYEFRYRSKSEKIIGNFFSIMSNLVYPPFFCLVFLIIMNFFGVLKYWQSWMYFIVFLISAISSIVLTIRYFANYRGIILYDDHLEIARYAIAVGNKPKMNFDIYYKDIVSVYNSYINLRTDRKKAKSFVVCYGDYSNYIEITLKGGKQFLFSIENQEEFVEEVIRRKNALENK